MMDILSKDTIRLLRDRRVRETAQEVAKNKDSDQSQTVTVETDTETAQHTKTKTVVVRRLPA